MIIGLPRDPLALHDLDAEFLHITHLVWLQSEEHKVPYGVRLLNPCPQLNKLIGHCKSSGYTSYWSIYQAKQLEQATAQY